MSRLWSAGPTGLLRRTCVSLLIFGLLIAVGLGFWRLAGFAGGLDHRLVASVVGQRTPALTSAAHAASAFGRSWVLIPATLVLGLALFPRLGSRAFGPLVGVLGAQQLQNIIKWLVHRPRPAVLHLEHVSSSSFPSGHATQTAAVGVAVALLTRSAPRTHRILSTLIIAAFIVCVSASRVYLGVHYPTDVIAGSLLGSAWGATAVWWCTDTRRDPPDGAG